MEKSIDFANILFFPSTIQEAKKIFIECTENYVTPLVTTFKISFKNGDKYKYDTEEEFWNGYRNSQMDDFTISFSYPSQDSKLYVTLSTIRNATQVSISLSNPANIHKIVGVFENA